MDGFVPDLRSARRRRMPVNGDTQSLASVDRLPPHSSEAECGVLGCLLLDAEACMDEAIMAFGKVGGEVFYDLRHQALYNAMVQLRDAHKPVDTITVCQALKDAQLLEQVGGMAYVSTLPDAVPSAANLSSYVDIVREKYQLRKLIQAATKVIGSVYDHEGDPTQLIDDAEREVLEVRQFSNHAEPMTMKAAVTESISKIEDFHARHGGLIGMSTGFADFDHLTGGLVNGEMILLAGRPSLGKTALAMNIVDHVALNLNMPVGVFSLEMTTPSLVMRMLCSRAHVNMKNIRDGFLAERDFPKLTIAAGRLISAPIFIDDSSGLSIMELRAKARRMKQKHGVKLFVVDYLQRLQALINGRRIEKRNQEVSEISGGLKETARELGVPILVISQLNRELEKMKRKPMLADLRESGSLEQDADLVGMLYRPDGDEETQATQHEDAIPVNMLIPKSRNGPTGEIQFTFIRSYTRFESAARVSDEDVVNDTPELTYGSCPREG